MALATIEERIARYLLEEPSEALRSEIEFLVESGTNESAIDLRNRMLPLTFGTAGLRGRMEAGFNRMNLVTVFRFSYALAECFSEKLSSEGIVVGYDGRLNSREFALEVVNVLESFGAKVYLATDAMPTPLIAYATKFYDAAAGVIITASHNPYADNGIKLFQKTSAQAHGKILLDIEQRMERAPKRNEFVKEASSSGRRCLMGEELISHYLKELDASAFFEADGLEKNLSVVYTPLHGVGGRIFTRALNDAGFHNIHPVAEQFDPDGNFPTVFFPNPEEDNALDCAHAYAREKNIFWVFANDPDADRLQVSCRTENGDLLKLTGNEMGAIFGYFALKNASKKGIRPMLASSLVSSRFLRAMCKKLDAQYIDALTGFSNIVNAAQLAESKIGARLVFAYEEAIGFLIDQIVLDKDGIHAGLRFMEIAAHLEKSRMTIWQLLDELYIEFGLFVADQWSLRFAGSSAREDMSAVMEKVRRIAEQEMSQIFMSSDMKTYDLANSDVENPYPGIIGDLVIFDASDARLIVRPSGTEPKIKFYLELSCATDRATLADTKMYQKKKVAKIRKSVEKIFAN